MQNEISIYRGSGLSASELKRQTIKIMAVFPKFPESMLELLKDRFKANGFNTERMIAAVNNVIDSYEGWDKLPNIANFISFDRKVKVYTFNQACEFGMKDLEMIDIGLDNPRWALKEDVLRYNLPKWDKSKSNNN